MSYTHFWVDFVTLLTTINPVAVVPLYLALTEGLEAQERTRVLRKATLVVSRIMGLVVTSLAMQVMISGLRNVFPGWQ